MRAPFVVSCVLMVGCGKVAEVNAGDGDATADAPSDAGSSSFGDGQAAFDSASGDASLLLVDGSCAPYWCGCGTCNSLDISCTSTPPVCALGCASDCPALAQVDCKTTYFPPARCVRVDLEAGTPQACLRDDDCPPGECCPIVNAQYSHCIQQRTPECGGP